MLVTLVMLLGARLRAIKCFRSGHRQKPLFRRLSEIAAVFALCGCAAGMTGNFSTGTSGVAEAVPEKTLRFAPRIALVIGNGSYTTWDRLDLSGNDATAMAKTLTASGFTLIGKGPQLDVRTERFRQLVEETAASIRSHPGAIVLVYFSGHGFAPQGRNKLVPVDAPGVSNPGASSASIDVTGIAQSLSAAGSGLTILLLDACRGAGDDAGEFVDVPVPPQTFIGFGTYFGTSSFQGPGQNSRYTAALLEAMKSHWDRLGDLHQVAANRVSLETSWHQIPVYRAAPGVAESRVRIAFPDPESAFARLNLNEAAGGAGHDQALLAARCASLGTMSLLTRFMDLRHFSLSQSELMTIEIPRSEISIPEVLTACRSAYVAGARDPATIRGYSMAIMADVLAASHNTTDSPSSPEERTGALALLIQAADSGDGIAETFLALAQAQVIGPSKVIDIPFDRKLAGVRLLHAAEVDETSPFPWMVGLSLMKPGAGFRDNADFDLPHDPHRGFQIILRAAQHYDPMALEILYLIRQKPQFFGYSEPFNFRTLIRESLDQPARSDTAGALVIKDMTVRQTLYVIAMLDAVGDRGEPPDFSAYVRLAVAAEPWFPKFLAFSKSPVPASNVGCALLGGIRSSYPTASVPHDVAMGARFLQMSVDAGNSKAEPALTMLRQGDDMPCSANIDGWGVRPR